MIRPSGAPSALSNLSEGPVIVKGVRYGLLKRDDHGRWSFIVEDGGRPGPSGQYSPNKALPRRVARAILIDYEERNPPPRTGPVTREDFEDLLK